MELQEFGRSSDDILATIASKRQGDARWQEGRTFGLVYDGGPEVHAIAEAVARIYLHDNALNTIAFPSLGEMQSEVCAWTAALLHEPNAAGFLTSGGTESILCAVLAARERGRVERGIDAPEMVLADTAHAAFHKAAHLFGVRVHKVPCRPDFRADVDAMAECVNERTVLVVGSAPQYPQGVVDPIPELSAVAARVGASMRCVNHAPAATDRPLNSARLGRASSRSRRNGRRPRPRHQQRGGGAAGSVYGGGVGQRGGVPEQFGDQQF